MKKKALGLIFTSLGLLTLASCGLGNVLSIKSTSSNNNEYVAEDVDMTEVDDAEDNYTNINSSFFIETEDGNYSTTNNIYTITSKGTYRLRGLLDNGQIVVDASDSDDIVIELNEAKITCDNSSPILILNASNVTIKALEDTYNEIIDNRSTTQVYDSSSGSAAISSECDLKISGSGSLVVNGNYNNGIDSSDDLKIKNITLKVNSYDNSLKGNDSVTIESGNIIAISKTGDTIKTKSSDISSSNNQKGTVSIEGGNVLLYAADNGIDSSYDVTLKEADELTETSLQIFTSNYSKYTTTAGSSASGIKSENIVTVDGGVISITAKTDGIHANRGTTLENGSSGIGNVIINGGKTYIQAGDDGIHSDYITTINDGYINVMTSNEGIEGSQVVFNGGTSKVYATDDGVNASGNYLSGLVTVTGGYLDVTVSTGDTDGVDSNGSYKQTGGTVVARNPNSNGGSNMAAIDCDSSITVSGGTLISVGSVSNTPSGSNLVTFGSSQSSGWNGFMQIAGDASNRPGSSSSSSYTFASGTYSIMDSSGNLIASFELESSYTGMWIASSNFKINESYSLSNGTSTYSWTQTSQKVTYQA